MSDARRSNLMSGWRRELCRPVLHAHPALREAGQPVDRNRMVEHQTCLGMGRRPIGQALRLQQLGIGSTIHVTRVHAQRHRRLPVVGRKNGIPVLRPVAPDLRDEPGRMGVARLWIGHPVGIEQRRVAQRIAQYAIDQPPRPSLAKQRAGTNGRMHSGMRRQTKRIDLMQAHPQQRLEIAIARFQRPGHEPSQDGAITQAEAQAAVAELLQQTAVGRRDR